LHEKETIRVIDQGAHSDADAREMLGGLSSLPATNNLLVSLDNARKPWEAYFVENCSRLKSIRRIDLLLFSLLEDSLSGFHISGWSWARPRKPRSYVLRLRNFGNRRVYMKRLCVVLSMPIVAAIFSLCLRPARANAARLQADTCTPGDCETHACIVPAAQTCNSQGVGWGPCQPCSIGGGS
jgi:hypothetical protein